MNPELYAQEEILGSDERIRPFGFGGFGRPGFGFGGFGRPFGFGFGRPFGFGFGRPFGFGFGRPWGWGFGGFGLPFLGGLAAGALLSPWAFGGYGYGYPYGYGYGYPYYGWY